MSLVPTGLANVPSEDLSRDILLPNLVARVPVLSDLVAVFPGEVSTLFCAVSVLLTLVAPVDVVAKLS